MGQVIMEQSNIRGNKTLLRYTFMSTCGKSSICHKLSRQLKYKMKVCSSNESAESLYKS